MKSILGIINQSPTGSSDSHEAIEMLMVYAAFGFQVSILLRGSGVLHLQKSQHPEVLKLKNHSALFAALDLYDVKSLLVDKDAVEQYHCEVADNVVFTFIDEQTISTIIASHSEVLNF